MFVKLLNSSKLKDTVDGLRAPVKHYLKSPETLTLGKGGLLKYIIPCGFLVVLVYIEMSLAVKVLLLQKFGLSASAREEGTQHKKSPFSPFLLSHHISHSIPVLQHLKSHKNSSLSSEGSQQTLI